MSNEFPIPNDQNDLGTLDFDIGHSSQGEVMVFVEPGWYVSDEAMTGVTNTSPSFFSASEFSVEMVAGLKDLFRVGGLTLRDRVLAFLELIVDRLTVREIVVEQTPPPFHDDALVGEGIVPAGAAEVLVPNDNVKETSKIFVTFTTDIGSRSFFVAEKREGEGFLVRLSSPVAKDVTFDWWIIQVENLGNVQDAEGKEESE